VSKIRILLVDDHALVRAAVSLWIKSQPDMEVAGEAGTAAEGVQRARETDPDVVLLDLTLPDANGLKVLQEIREDCPGARVLILTMHDEVSYLLAALAAGAAGYLVKSAEMSELRTAIQAVHRGRSSIGIPIQEGGLDALIAQRAPSPVEAGAPVRLSCRETQILKLLSLGHTYREIAEELHLSERSVETYRSRLSEKLGIRSRAGLVRYALMTGLLDEKSVS
jgi:two-component system response regulator NreC